MPLDSLQNIKRLYTESDEVRLILGEYEQISKYYTASLEAMGLLQKLNLGIGNTATTLQVSGSMNTTDK